MADEKKKTKTKKEDKEKQKWGKSQRLLVLFTFLATITMPLFFSIKNNNLSFLKTSPSFSNFSLSKKYFFTNPTPIPVENKADKVLVEFKTQTTNLPGIWGFYYLDLNTNESVGLYDNETFPAVNLLDTLILMALYKDAELGLLDITKTRELSRDISLAKEKLGARKIQVTINDLELTHTSMSDNTSSPKDITTMLTKLNNNEFINPEFSQEVLDIFSQTPQSNIIIDDNSIFVVLSKGGQNNEKNQILFQKLQEALY